MFFPTPLSLLIIDSLYLLNQTHKGKGKGGYNCLANKNNPLNSTHAPELCATNDFAQSSTKDTTNNGKQKAIKKVDKLFYLSIKAAHLVVPTIIYSF